MHTVHVLLPFFRLGWLVNAEAVLLLMVAAHVGAHWMLENPLGSIVVA